MFSFFFSYSKCVETDLYTELYFDIVRVGDITAFTPISDPSFYFGNVYPAYFF